jgi:hypothetical protein
MKPLFYADHPVECDGFAKGEATALLVKGVLFGRGRAIHSLGSLPGDEEWRTPSVSLAR